MFNRSNVVHAVQTTVVMAILVVASLDKVRVVPQCGRRRRRRRLCLAPAFVIRIITCSLYQRHEDLQPCVLRSLVCV